MSPEEIREVALFDQDAAQEEWDPDQLEWNLDPALPLKRFLGIMSGEEWRAWFWEEHRAACNDGRAGYLNLLAGKIIEPVVAVLDEQGEQVIDLWDGWHRTAAYFVRGEGNMKAITARSYKPSLEASPGF